MPSLPSACPAVHQSRPFTSLSSPPSLLVKLHSATPQASRTPYKSLKLRRKNFTIGLNLFALIATGPVSIAGTVWDADGGTNANITTATNWNDNNNPAFDGTATVTFATAGTRAVINSNVNFAGIIINRDANFTIANGAGSLTIGSGGIGVALPTATTRAHLISESSLILGGDQTWALTNNGAGAAVLTVSSLVQDGTNTYGITKAGSGRLNLSGNNSFDGAMLVNDGALRISSDTALGSATGSTTVASGAALQLTGGITVAGEALTISGSGQSSTGALRSLSNNNAWTGGIVAGEAARIASDADILTISGGIDSAGFALTIGGAGHTTVSTLGITGGGSLTKDGAGTLTLSGNSTYTGGTTLSEGTLRLGHINGAGTGTVTQSSGASTLQIAAAGTITNAMSVYNVVFATNAALSGNLTLNNATFDVTDNLTATNAGLLSGTGGITKAGVGTLVIAGTASNTFTGSSVVDSGALVLSNSGGGAISGTNIQVNTNASLVLAANNQIGDSTGLILNGGTFIAGNASAGYSDTLGTLTLSANSTIDLGSYGGGLRTITFANSSSIIWTTGAVLTITNWQGMAGQSSGVAEILFGTGGLTSDQLAQISFAPYGGRPQIDGGLLLASGELAPIPEAPVWLGALAVCAFIVWREWRRHRHTKSLLVAAEPIASRSEQK